jgi:hypothetical protein
MIDFMIGVADFCIGRPGAWWTRRPWKYFFNNCGKWDCGFCMGLRMIYVLGWTLYGGLLMAIAVLWLWENW